MNILGYKLYYFIGIGGIGMSALARFFKHYGKHVAGYDRTQSEITRQLTEEDVSCHYTEDVTRLKKILERYGHGEVLVIVTPAVPAEHAELVYLKTSGFLLRKRAEVLGDISRAFKTIAIAGTHGKTTTTTLVTHLLKTAGIECFSFMGGISKNYNTNLLLGDIDDAGSYVVVEADEYDRSFLQLSPHIAVITSCDADHLDIYGDADHVRESYALFAEKLKENGVLIVKKTVDNDLRLNRPRHIYSLNLDTRYRVENMRVNGAEFTYDVVSPVENIPGVCLGIPGAHNVENSVAAIAVAQAAGVKADAIREGLRSFKGVKRRFDYRVRSARMVFIDDYAHHPAELAATIGAARAIYPGKKITGIFQPHLFTRTRDFGDGFAQSLDMLDVCLLLDIYPAREKPLAGITSDWLLAKMKLRNKKVVTKEQAIAMVRDNPPEVLLTMGAGDIDGLADRLEKILVNV